MEAQDCVVKSHLVLSANGRPAGWRIQFANRSIANAVLRSAKKDPLRCAWKTVSVKELKQETSVPPEVDESWIRVENCYPAMTVDHLRHIFRRYDLARDGPAIQRWESEETGFQMFLIHFADASWARAAIRELQGVDVKGKALELFQYPKQIR